MIIYIISISLILISAYLFRNNKKWICIISGIILWGLLAFRNIKIGLYDTENVYLPYFNMILDMNFIDIFLYEFMSDKGFYVIMKIISIITKNYQICIAIFAVPFIYLITRQVYMDSKNILFSIIIFIALYYAYAFFLLRQVIAMGIIVYSYKYIRDKKIIKFILTVIVASLFHGTALIFLIAYPICNYIKAGDKNYIAIFGAFIIGRHILDILLKIFTIIPIFDRYVYSIENGFYSTESAPSIWGLIMTVLILSVSHFFYKKSEKEDGEMNILLNLSTLGSIFYCFSASIAEFYRIALYFSIFNILLLPNALNLCENKKIRYAINIIAIIAFIGYFFVRTIFNTNIYPYIFFR